MTQPRRTRKAEQSEATRRTLVAVATELFGARGFTDVSIEDVVRTAGMTRGALYHHFTNKEDLFRAVFRAAEADLAQRVAAAAADEPDPFLRLRTALLAALEAAGDPRIHRIVLEDGTAVLGWRESRAIMQEHALGLLRDALANAADAGELTPVDLDAAAHLLTGALTEAALLVGGADHPDATRKAAAEALGTLLEGLRPR